MRQHAVELVPVSVPGIEAVSADSDFAFGRHTHDQFGIGFMDSGAQKSLSGRGKVESKAGDIITVNPGEVHDGSPLCGPRAWRMLYVDPELINRNILAISEGKCHCREFTQPVLTDHNVAANFARLYNAVVLGEGDVAKLAADEALILIVSTLSEFAVHQENLPLKSIAFARERMDDDPAHAVTLAELAACAGVSQFQFLRAFKRYSGMTPHAYLLQRRLGLVRKLIAGGMPLSETAAAAGFADQSHMTRLFMRSFGYTPGRFAQHWR
ncbi:AraC family transcriptional regulator [Yokenella regensburgei]|uniref:AraC family transcriptional regulator n=1 Tax=Yokenella regensburgei TaxID=158877 RepID=UPI003F1568F8